VSDPNPLPPLLSAPFWQQISPDELGRLLNDPPGPGWLDLASGWELALFSINQGEDERHTIWGWVRGDFGVSLASTDMGPLGCISHLGCGFRVGLFAHEEEAAFAADLLQPIADWSAVTPSTARLIGPEVFATLRSAHFERVRAPGLGLGETQHVWVRETGVAH